jgi:hypothetical protein
VSQEASRIRSTPTVGNKTVLVLALVAGIGFVIGFVFPYFRLTPESFGVYWQKRGWLLLHITTGTIALLLGPFALWLGLARRRMYLHRMLGVTYMVSIALSCTAAYYLAFHTEVSWIFGMGLAGLATAWLVTTGLALISIRKRMISQHQEWMIRSYVVTLAFVNFRILVGILQVAGVGTLVERLNAASWFCWAFPLLMTEVILQGRKILKAPSPASSFETGT